MKTLDHYKLGNFNLPFFVRFNKSAGLIDQEFVDSKAEFLTVGYIPETDEILLMTPSPRDSGAPDYRPVGWCLLALLKTEAEYGDTGFQRAWGPFGYSVTLGDLSVEECERLYGLRK